MKNLQEWREQQRLKELAEPFGYSDDSEPNDQHKAEYHKELSGKVGTFFNWMRQALSEKLGTTLKPLPMKILLLKDFIVALGLHNEDPAILMKALSRVRADFNQLNNNQSSSPPADIQSNPGPFGHQNASPAGNQNMPPT